MSSNSRLRNQLAVFGGIILVIAGVLSYSFLYQGKEAALPVFSPPAVNKNFSRAVFDNPEYIKLEKSPIKLPIDPGPKGRENPFETFTKTAEPLTQGQQ